MKLLGTNFGYNKIFFTSILAALPTQYFLSLSLSLLAANVTLQEPVYMVNESDAYVMVCAELTKGVLERSVTVYLSTFDGTAVTPGDYTSKASYPLTFSAGSPVGITQCANISIIDDLVVEPDQYFTVSLTTTDPVYITPISLAQVVIDDNDCELLTSLSLSFSLFSLSLSLSLSL